MKKYLISCILAVVLLLNCCMTAYAITENDESGYIDTYWAVYYGEINFVNDDGVELNFAVKYDYLYPGDDYYFWVGYIPNGKSIEDVTVWQSLSSMQHTLNISDDGTYLLLVSEKALMETYEFWKEAEKQ